MDYYTISIEQLRAEISKLDHSNLNVVERTEKSIQLVKSVCLEFEKSVLQNGFLSDEEEIHFFKHIKPTVYSLLIAYKIILNIEMTRLTSSKKEVKILINRKLDFVKLHYEDYPEFTAYFVSKKKVKDELYFLLRNGIHLDCYPDFYDEKNSTGYDIIAIYALAYRFLVNYFEKCDQSHLAEDLKSDVEWTASKIALGELVYGVLAMKSLNGGNIDVAKAFSLVSRMLNVSIPEPYGMLRELSERKGDRCKYLKQMIEALEAKLDKREE